MAKYPAAANRSQTSFIWSTTPHHSCTTTTAGPAPEIGSATYAYSTTPSLVNSIISPIRAKAITTWRNDGSYNAPKKMVILHGTLSRSRQISLEPGILLPLHLCTRSETGREGRQKLFGIFAKIERCPAGHTIQGQVHPLWYLYRHQIEYRRPILQ